MTWISNLDLVKRLPLFALLTAEQAQVVADNVVKRRYKRGETIVTQGGMGGEMIVIIAGRARVMTQDWRGREAILATLTNGDCIGEMSVVDGAPHSATVRAQVQCDTLVLSREFLQKALPQYAGLANALLYRTVKRLRQANSQFESLALLQLQERVARALMNMSEVVDGTHVIRQRINRQDIAKQVAASREGVGRAMKHLVDSGRIEVGSDGKLRLWPPPGSSDQADATVDILLP